MRSALVLVLVSATTSAGTRYGLGRAPTGSEIAATDISISPTGTGLPPGHGAAREGEAIYLARCAGCHGLSGEGLGDFPALVGGRGTLATAGPVLTVGSYWPYATTLFDYIRRAMPYNTPGALRAGEVYALVAFVLFKNGIVALDTTLDRHELPRITMPNRNGFVSDPRPDVGRDH